MKPLQLASFVAGAMLAFNSAAQDGLANRVKPGGTPPRPQMSGTVRDTNGTPLEGVEVKRFPDWGIDPSVRTDGNGHYQFMDRIMSAGRNLAPFLFVRDRERNLAVASDVREGTDTYDLQLAPAVIISGRVQNEQAKPLTNVIVCVYVWSGNSQWGLNSPTMKDDNAKCDANGRFEVRGLPVERRYSLNISAKGYGSASSKILEPGTNHLDLETFTLRPADRKVAGVVLDPEGNPVKGAFVYISYGEGQPDTSVQSDDKGRFALNVCPGVVGVAASVQALTANMRAEGGDTNLVLTLGQQGRMRSQPRRALLVGNPLPDLTAAGISAVGLQTNKPLLICLFDPEQRPSRRTLRLLADQNDALKQKGVTVVGVSAALTTTDALKEWKQANPTPFAVGGVTEKNDKTQWILKTEKFPWLILTDAQGRVKAEGFELDELDAKIK